MINPVLYLNGAVTIAENIFNVIGYLPRNRFERIKEQSETYRFRFGLIQSISGIALAAIGQLIDILKRTSESQKYLSLAQQMTSLGILYLNHGIFNIARSYAEQKDLGAVLCAYDVYGRKLLPPLAPRFDFSGLFFDRIRKELDRIHFMTLIPPAFCLRK